MGFRLLEVGKLRIALLAMTEPAGAGQPFPRAYLRVAGASLAQHQLGFALAFDCQRLICIAHGSSPDLIALQHAAEDAGLQFHVVSGARQLAGLVTANDELLVISEGLFADPASIEGLMSVRGAVVVVQPIEGALAAGFERIDLNRASAGLARVPGALVERLQDLGPDCDAASALTRLALQSGARMAELPATARLGAGWTLVRNETEALGVETAWLRQQFGNSVSTSPGRALSRFGVLAFGSSLLQAGNASNTLGIGVLLVLGLGGVLGWFGFAWGGLVCAALAWLFVEAIRKLRVAERHVTGTLPPAVPRADLLGWIIDVVIAGLLLAASPRYPGEPFLVWLAQPVVLMLLAGLVARTIGGQLSEWIGDRLVLSLVLAGTAMFGLVDQAVMLLSIILLGVALLFRPRVNG